MRTVIEEPGWRQAFTEFFRVVWPRDRPWPPVPLLHVTFWRPTNARESQRTRPLIGPFFRRHRGFSHLRMTVSRNMFRGVPRPIRRSRSTTSSILRIGIRMSIRQCRTSCPTANRPLCMAAHNAISRAAAGIPNRRISRVFRLRTLKNNWRNSGMAHERARSLIVRS